MKKVAVYFEGPSDIAAMRQLFGGLIKTKSSAEVSIHFFQAAKGDRKKTLLMDIPKRAARMLNNGEADIVAIVPDLYPRNKGFDHHTIDELQNGAYAIFVKECARIAPKMQNTLTQRFKVFCFKHDLEALLLACPDALKYRLNTSKLLVNWAKSVEDQNHDDPPKEVIKRLFTAHNEKYDEVVDAPLLLEGCDYHTLAKDCSQGFKPFAEFLENL